jgi:hypothetical protein
MLPSPEIIPGYSVRRMDHGTRDAAGGGAIDRAVVGEANRWRFHSDEIGWAAHSSPEGRGRSAADASVPSQHDGLYPNPA